MLCCVDSLTSKSFSMVDHVWNHPWMHCKPLIIEYVMYAYGLFFWNARNPYYYDPCIQFVRENLNWPIKIQQAGKTLQPWHQWKFIGNALKSGSFSCWKLHQLFIKRDLQLPKPCQFLKSEKYEDFFVFKLLIRHQKWVAIIRHGNSLIVHRVSPGRVIVVLFWTK